MSQTNKEIIKATREFRDVMTADTAIIEIAKMLSTSADRLDVTTAALREVTKQRDAKDVIIQQLAAENAYLLPKAASELSNAWVLNKYWVGIHVALMHVNAGRLHDGMTWLQNTISGPGIEAPQLSDFAEIEAWAVEQQKGSISHIRALEIIKAETPATDAALAEIEARGLDEMASEYRKFAQEDGCSCNMQSSYNLTAERAESYAAYIRRKGAAV